MDERCVETPLTPGHVIDLGKELKSVQDTLAALDKHLPPEDKILDIQKHELAENKIYREGWLEATRLFTKEKHHQMTAEDAAVDDEYHIALISYTLGGKFKIFEDFNAQTRSLTAKSNFNGYHYKSYFKLLILAVEKVHAERLIHGWIQSPKVYRGCTGQVENAKEGQTIMFQQFISTSSDEKKTEKFGKDVLFVFIVDKAAKYITMNKHSAIVAVEKEALFSPIQKYKITKIEKKDTQTRIILQTMK